MSKTGLNGVALLKFTISKTNAETLSVQEKYHYYVALYLHFGIQGVLPQDACLSLFTLYAAQ